LSTRQVRDLVRISRPPYDPALTLRVAATLAALGVPARQGVRLTERLIEAGREPGDLLDLPGEVQQGMARGASAAEAAEGLEQGHRGEGEGPQGHRKGQEGEEGRKGQQGGHRKP
jgi:hypothetical protein